MENNTTNTPPATELVKQFNDNLQTNLQTKLNDTPSKLQKAVTIDNFSGKTKPYCFHKLPLTRDIILEHGWVTKSTIECFEMSDKRDETYFERASTENSTTIQNASAMVNTGIDRAIIAAALGDTQRGELGQSSLPLPEKYKLSVATSKESFFKDFFNKLEHAQCILDFDTFPQEDRYLVVPRTMATSLKDVKHLNLIVSTLLPIKDGQRSCILFHKSAIRGAIDPVKTYMDIRADLQDAWQIHSTMDIGFSRLQNNGVVEIKIPV